MVFLYSLPQNTLSYFNKKAVSKMTKHHNVKLLQENNMGSQLKLYGK